MTVKRLRRLFGALAFLSFFFLLGSVGAVEQNSITLTQGVIQMGAGLMCLCLFTWLAGGFR